MPPGGRLALEACSYVYAIPVEIVSIHDEVAEMQPDAKHDPCVLRLIPIGLGHCLLELDGRAKRVNGAGELDQRAVAGQFDQPPAVAREQGL